MPLECSKLFDDAYEFSFSSIGLNKIFKSNLYTSILLTAIIIFIIVLLFPSKQNTPICILFKVGFYIFIVSYITLFLYGCVIKNTNSKKKENEEIMQYGGVEQDVINFGGKKIEPNLGGREIVGGESYDTDGGETDKSGESSDYISDGGKNNDDNIFALYGV